MDEREQLKQAIALLESQRAMLGNSVVELGLAPLREKLAELEAQSRPMEQRRKQVTVLFADISGFTAMSELLDPEVVTEVLNALWQRLDAAIVEQGGWIDKHIGDAVMALWGVETVQEDDPERAVRAALEMQSALARFREEQGVELAMRIGINTGPVLLGEVGSRREFTAMGDTVNVASRLEHAAPVGGVLISHDTYRHVRGVFDVQTPDPIQVKGKADLLRVYVVERAKPQAFRLGNRGVEGIETSMVGRDVEMQQLQATLRKVVQDRCVQTVLLVGEAGLGKSRLLYEFQNWLETLPERVIIFTARALESVHQPYGVLQDCLAFRFQIAQNDPLPVAREKFEQGVIHWMAGDAEAGMKAHFIGHLIGLDFSGSPHLQGILEDAQQIQGRAWHYLEQFFAAVAQQGAAVVLELEDLHWADDSSLAVLNYLMESRERFPLLILGATRPGLFERYPEWGTGISSYVRLEMAPLIVGESERLVAEILKKLPSIPEALPELIVKRAEGNPFYIEELIKMLIDRKAIVPGEDVWQVDDSRMVQTEIPMTLTHVLQVRLESLREAERGLLQQASVVGPIFWDMVLARMKAGGNQEGAEVLSGQLRVLQERELIFCRKTTVFTGTREYTFKHGLMQEVVYETVLLRMRREYHAQVAEWLIEQGVDRVGKLAGLTAHHLELSGQLERARDYFRLAGKQSAAQYANLDAVHYFSRALELCPETAGECRYELLSERGACKALLGLWEQQKSDLEQMMELAEKLQDVKRQIQVMNRQAVLYLDLGNRISAKQMAESALEMADKMGDQKMIGDALIGAGVVDARVGSWEPARTCYLKALAAYRESGDRLGEAISLTRLGSTFYYCGENQLAENYHREAAGIYHELGNLAGESDGLNSLGIVAKDYALKRQYYEKALSIAERIGDRFRISRGYNNLGAFYGMLGQYEHARSYSESAVRTLREMRGRGPMTFYLATLGCIYLDMGLLESAQPVLEEGITIAKETGHRFNELICCFQMGRRMFLGGDFSRACDYLNFACRGLQEIKAVGYEEGWAWLGLAYLQQDQLEQAYECTSRAVSLVQEIDSSADYPIQDVWWFHYLVLKARSDKAEMEPVADEVWEILRKAYESLYKVIADLNDEELRSSYLENVVINRAILQEWAVQSRLREAGFGLPS